MRNVPTSIRPFWAIAAFGLLTAACSLRAANATEWVRYAGQGFVLEHPAGWQIESSAEQGTIAAQGPAGQQLTMWPIFVRKEFTPGLARLVAGQLARRVAPEVNWQVAPKVAGTAVKLVGRDDAGNGAVASLSWVAAKPGTAATFTCAIAPAETFAQAAGLFAEILASLRLQGSVEETPDAGLAFETWRDPHENAFEVEIPQGWQVQGGLARFGESDTRPVIEVRSPDGSLRVYLGDAHTPTFVVPTPTLAGAGFVEGSWYAPPLGMRMQVRRFMSGAQFARWFVTNTVAREMTSLRFTVVRNRPDLDRLLAGILRRAEAPDAERPLNAGELLYTCREQDRSFVGYAFAATLEKPLSRGQGDQWSVVQNYGYLAPTELAPTAESVLRRMVASFRYEPAWVAKQNHLAPGFAAIAARSATELAETIGETSEAERGKSDRETRLRETENVVVDVTDATDPATGMPLRVESGAGYYWLDPRENIIGTEHYSVPNVDPRELLRRPR
ncbi:MAG: hypothetical protein KF708_12585 [Pirellulales bacterium]|nr:hypothetical protein [Pirellulales bacterium]